VVARVLCYPGNIFCSQRHSRPVGLGRRNTNPQIYLFDLLFHLIYLIYYFILFHLIYYFILFHLSHATTILCGGVVTGQRKLKKMTSLSYAWVAEMTSIRGPRTVRTA
jgi:hypothetical protein